MKVYLTKQRKLLISFLELHKDEFLSAEGIQSAVKGISLSAVYRNLASLTEQGIIRKSFSKDGNTALYQYCEKEKCHAHMHVKCNMCGKMQCVAKENSDKIASILSKDDSFIIDEPGTIIYGRCRECSKQGKS